MELTNQPLETDELAHHHHSLEEQFPWLRHHDGYIGFFHKRKQRLLESVSIIKVH